MLQKINKQNDKKVVRDYARTFSTESGKKVIKHLRDLTIERIVSPETTNEMLRHIEGQRSIVRMIEQFIESGKRG